MTWNRPGTTAWPLTLQLLVVGGTWFVPGADAAHWCTGILVSSSPSQATAEDRIAYSVTLHNTNAAAVSVNLRVRFPWDTQAAFWGSMTIGPGESKTNTYTKFIADMPGEHAVTVTVQGNTTGEDLSPCNAVQRPLRVEPAPVPPSVLLVANATHGSSPLVVRLEAVVAGGMAPVELRWITSANDTVGNLTTTMRLGEPGDHLVTVVVKGARGRIASDSITIQVEGATAPGTEADGAFVAVERWGPIAIDGTTLVVLLVVMLLLRRATLPPTGEALSHPGEAEENAAPEYLSVESPSTFSGRLRDDDTTLSDGPSVEER